MKTKLLLIFVVAAIGIASGCGPLNTCERCGFTRNGIVLVQYRDGTCCPSQRRADSDGCLTVARPNSGNCADVIYTDLGFGFQFTASPAEIDLMAPPANVTLIGQGLSTSYGMPVAEYFDYSGRLVGSATTTSVASDGTWMVATTPNLSSVYSGTYTILISNISSTGQRQVIGHATGWAYGRDEPPPPPDDGGGDCPDECMPILY